MFNLGGKINVIITCNVKCPVKINSQDMHVSQKVKYT